MRDAVTVKRLERLLLPMDLPWNRKQDLTPAKLCWLRKNLADRNERHVDYIECMRLIENLIKDG